MRGLPVAQAFSHAKGKRDADDEGAHIFTCFLVSKHHHFHISLQLGVKSRDALPCHELSSHCIQSMATVGLLPDVDPASAGLPSHWSPCMLLVQVLLQGNSPLCAGYLMTDQKCSPVS